MNVASNFLIFSIIFSIWKKTYASDTYLLRDERSPLGVFVRKNGEKWRAELAEPIAYEDPSYLHYTFSRGNDEDFIAACPQSSEQNTLYEKRDYYSQDFSKANYEMKCDYDFVPTFQDFEEECGDDSNAHFVGVGYWLKNNPNEIANSGILQLEESKFLEMYAVCRVGENTYFTVHETFPVPAMEKKNTDTQNITESNKFFYQFVPYDDMPTHTWQITTQSYKYNKTAVSQYALRHLNEVDKTIQNSIREFGHKFRIYSGFHEMKEGVLSCKYIFKVLHLIGDVYAAQNQGFVLATIFDSPGECFALCTNINAKMKDSVFHLPLGFMDPDESRIKYLLNKFPTWTPTKPYTYACNADKKTLEELRLHKSLPNALGTSAFFKKKTQRSAPSATGGGADYNDAGVTSSSNTNTNDMEGLAAAVVTSHAISDGVGDGPGCDG